MPRFRIFRRRWWRDRACTEPGAGRKFYTGQTALSEAEARELCARANEAAFGSRNGRGPYGAAHEYESY